MAPGDKKRLATSGPVYRAEKKLKNEQTATTSFMTEVDVRDLIMEGIRDIVHVAMCQPYHLEDGLEAVVSGAFKTFNPGHIGEDGNFVEEPEILADYMKGIFHLTEHLPLTKLSGVEFVPADVAQNTIKVLKNLIKKLEELEPRQMMVDTPVPLTHYNYPGNQSSMQYLKQCDGSAKRLEQGTSRQRNPSRVPSDHAAIHFENALKKTVETAVKKSATAIKIDLTPSSNCR